jgi:hypothetical protein
LGPLTLREENKLMMSENWVLRRIFGPKRDEVAGGWRELHNEELHNFYPLPSTIKIKIKESEIGGTCGTHTITIK